MSSPVSKGSGHPAPTASTVGTTALTSSPYVADTTSVSLPLPADPSRARPASSDVDASPVRREKPDWVPSVEVVAAAREGDRAALSDIYRGGYPRLVAFYRFSGLDGHEAEDLAADALEAVVAGIRRLRAAIAFEAWFWAIARTHFKRWLRRNRRPRRTEPMAPPPAEPWDLVEQAEEHRQIREALATLSPRDRQLLWLREVEGMSYAEIGGRIGAASGAVRVATHRARNRLERALKGIDDAHHTKPTPIPRAQT